MSDYTLKFKQTDYLKNLILAKIGQPDSLEIEHEGNYTDDDSVEVTIWACLKGDRLFQMGPTRLLPGEVLKIEDIKIEVSIDDEH